MEDSPEPDKDPVVSAVFSALASPEYDFRSPEGISRETGLPIEEVNQVLADNADLIRRPLVQPADGRPLFTLAGREPGWRERYMQVRSYLTKQVASW